MTEAFTVADEPARNLSLEMVGEVVGQTIAASLDDTKTGREMLATLLTHELAGCHCLMLRFAGFANGFLDRSGPGSTGGAGERAGHEAMRLAGTMARLMERYRVGALALVKLRPYEAHECGPKTFVLDTGIDRPGPPGWDRHWEKDGNGSDGGAAPPAGGTGPASGAAASQASSAKGAAAGHDFPAGHGVDRPFSGHAAGGTEPVGPQSVVDLENAPVPGCNMLHAAADRSVPAGHGVDRPFSGLAAGETEPAGPGNAADPEGALMPGHATLHAAADRSVPAGHGVDRPFSGPAAGHALSMGLHPWMHGRRGMPMATA